MKYIGDVTISEWQGECRKHESCHALGAQKVDCYFFLLCEELQENNIGDTDLASIRPTETNEARKLRLGRFNHTKKETTHATTNKEN